LSSAFDVESEPPAIITSASPRSIAAAASVIACSPLAHARVTVMPSTDGGRRRSKRDLARDVGRHARQDHAAPDHRVDGVAWDARGVEQRPRRGDPEPDAVDARELAKRADERGPAPVDDHRAARRGRGLRCSLRHKLPLLRLRRRRSFRHRRG
jgi:hypothetical protein